MSMDRILARLSEPQPLGVSELAGIVGCSRSHVHKLITAGAIEVGRVGRDYRIPVQEARRVAREAGIKLE